MDAGEKKVADQAVRVVCRYGNGLLQSSVARGVSLKDDILSVITRAQYEPGVVVSVMAPFLAHTRGARVKTHHRAGEAGVFAMELMLDPEAANTSSKTAEIEESSGEVFRSAAAVLAVRLEQAGWTPYYQAAFERATAIDRARFLAATEVAVFSLLANAGLTEFSILKDRVERQSR